MPSAPIEFGASTAPGLTPTEAGPRLINAYAERAPIGGRSEVLWRRAPGLTQLLPGVDLEPRGALAIGGVLYAVLGDKVYSITKANEGYSFGILGGLVPGVGKVMIERNQRAPSPQILIWHSAGLSQINGNVVLEFTDPDLPAINSLAQIDGYFIATTASGRAYASGLNDITFAENDYTTAEASPDPIVRAIAMRRDLLLMGSTTIEFYSNVGNATGFPFQRGHVLPIGLLAPFAVAGQEQGFPSPICFVGNDRAVYRLNGYSPERISPPALDRMIEALGDPNDLEASVYVAAGHACWVLSTPWWTWVFDIVTGEWHERQSIGRSRWRARLGVNAFDRWVTFDRESGAMFQVDDRNPREGTDPLVFDVRSAQMHRFPGRLRVNKASFDFATGVGLDRGIAPIETNPKASISWSDDGGVSFGNALLRDLGTQGEHRRIDVHRCGLTGRNGRQWRLQVSDPVEVTLMGGVVDVEARAP
jgi:hypothetical protein